MALPLKVQPGQAPDPFGLARQNLQPMLRNLFGDAADTVLAGLLDDRQRSDRIIVDADLSHLRKDDKATTRQDRIQISTRWEPVITGAAPGMDAKPGKQLEGRPPGHFRHQQWPPAS